LRNSNEEGLFDSVVYFFKNHNEIPQLIMLPGNDGKFEIIREEGSA